MAARWPVAPGRETASTEASDAAQQAANIGRSGSGLPWIRVAAQATTASLGFGPRHAWEGAPTLRNAVTGGPMELGPGPGNFDYTVTSTGNYYKLSGHLYGGGESTIESGFALD